VRQAFLLSLVCECLAMLKGGRQGIRIPGAVEGKGRIIRTYAGTSFREEVKQYPKISSHWFSGAVEHDSLRNRLR